MKRFYTNTGIEMSHYVKTMRGIIQRARGYGQDGFELAVTVSFDAKEFNRIKKTQDPLAAGMSQIKNVVLDACGVRGMPSYAPQSYAVRYPRASKGLVTLTVYFDVSRYNAEQLGVSFSNTQIGTLYSSHSIDLQTTLEATRNDGHLFAKTAIASHFGN